MYDKNPVIEKNIPIPSDNGYKNGSFKPLYVTVDEMEIGDSFWRENKTIPYTYQARFPNKRFAVRAESGGFRFWRTA